MGGIREVVIQYEPRPLQMSMHEALERLRFAVAVCHRRFGKTVLSVNQLIRRAITARKLRPRYAYIGPTYRQAKQNAWDYLLHYSRDIPGMQPNVSELRVDFPHNKSQIRIFGADNPDSLRGMYLDGVVMDEYGMMPSKIWGEIIRPALSDRRGWALFLGTPAGRNQFYELIYGDGKDWVGAKHHPDWHFAEYKASQTGYLAPEELAAARQDMTSDEYAQEFECSFEAAIKGAIYAKELEAARAEGRITSVRYDPALPVDTDWDIGGWGAGTGGDSTAIWFSQSLRNGEVRLIDYHENSGEGIQAYAAVLKAKGYVYGKHYGPHDMAVHEMDGRSRLSVALAHGIKFELTPRIAVGSGNELEEGIHALRMLFPRLWFDEQKCKAGIECLQNYRRDYNSRLDEFKAMPVHDWACFTQDTKVLTRHGARQIMDLPENGEVLTPCGWKRYLGPKITRKNARLVEVAFSDGHTVRCTPDHSFVTESGWISAENLTLGLRIPLCSIHSASTSMDDFIDSGRRKGTSLVEELGFIVMSGVRHLARYLTDAISIIGTAIRQTTLSPTWRLCPPGSTSANLGSSMEPSAASTSLLLLGRQPRNGTAQRLEELGIVGMPTSRHLGRSGREKIGRVNTAAKSFMEPLFARMVTRRNTVPRLARHLHIVSVTPLAERADTCCIHVPGIEAFALANGVVAHNSHGADAARGLAVRHKTPQEKRKSAQTTPMPQNWSWT